MIIEPDRGGACPRCGAPFDAGQEYCLECGSRLPRSGTLAPGVAAAWRRRGGASAGPWLGPVLVGLLIAAAMTGIAILIARGTDSDARNILIATGETGFALPTTETLTAPETAETATEPSPTTTAAPPSPPRRTLIEWPPSQSGYTVVIASLPAGGGRAHAVRKAREALRNGLREVGVLESGEFSSLHPGYYVVFSGIYENQRDALRAVPRVQDLYPVAYLRQISR